MEQVSYVGFYLELIRTVFQAVDELGKLRNRTVAFTAATPGEGVSHVVSLVAEELANKTQSRVLLVDSAALENLYLAEPNQIGRYCEETDIDNLLTLAGTKNTSRLDARGTRRATDWDSSAEYRATCLNALRWNFDYVLIDCPSLAVSSGAATLAPNVDGVAIVVKAANTRRGQIKRSQEMIETAGGRFLGFVLNQRLYPIPNWLYRML